MSLPRVRVRSRKSRSVYGGQSGSAPPISASLWKQSSRSRATDCQDACVETNVRRGCKNCTRPLLVAILLIRVCDHVDFLDLRRSKCDMPNRLQVKQAFRDLARLALASYVLEINLAPQSRSSGCSKSIFHVENSNHPGLICRRSHRLLVSDLTGANHGLSNMWKFSRNFDDCSMESLTPLATRGA